MGDPSGVVHGVSRIPMRWNKDILGANSRCSVGDISIQRVMKQWAAVVCSKCQVPVCCLPCSLSRSHDAKVFSSTEVPLYLSPVFENLRLAENLGRLMILVQSFCALPIKVCFCRISPWRLWRLGTFCARTPCSSLAFSVCIKPMNCLQLVKTFTIWQYGTYECNTKEPLWPLFPRTKDVQSKQKYKRAKICPICKMFFLQSSRAQTWLASTAQKCRIWTMHILASFSPAQQPKWPSCESTHPQCQLPSSPGCVWQPSMYFMCTFKKNWGVDKDSENIPSSLHTDARCLSRLAQDIHCVLCTVAFRALCTSLLFHCCFTVMSYGLSSIIVSYLSKHCIVVFVLFFFHPFVSSVFSLRPLPRSSMQLVRRPAAQKATGRSRIVPSRKLQNTLEFYKKQQMPWIIEEISVLSLKHKNTKTCKMSKRSWLNYRLGRQSTPCL